MNKPDPNKGNVSQFPNADLPHEYHVAQADELCPATLSYDEQAVWAEIAPELSKLGRLKKIYVEVIAEYCRLVVRMQDTRLFLDENDWSYVTTGRHGVQHKSRPEVAQLNDDWRKFRSLVSELGLSPSAERNLSTQLGLPLGDFANF